MTPPWVVEFYESDEEGCPVQEFLDGLDKRRRAKLLAAVKLLEEQGPMLPKRDVKLAEERMERYLEQLEND